MSSPAFPAPLRLWMAGAVLASAIGVGSVLAGLGGLVADNWVAVGWIGPVLILMGAAAVTVVRAHSRRVKTPKSESGLIVGITAPTLFLPPHGALSSMTTAELCVTWERSSIALTRLRRCGTVHAQLRVVAARQDYLDELERRNPRGFAVWLGRGAESHANPGGYLLSPPPEV